MKTFTKWIVRKSIADYQNISDPTVRSRYGLLEAGTSIFVNMLLFVLKAILGVVTGSISLIVDAVHTLSDTGTSIIILIGFRVAKKPGDTEHPFGHGRAESIAALIVAVLLIVAGIELTKSSVIRILHPQIEPGRISWTIAAILLGTVIVKELIARFARQLSEMIDSKTLKADFWHHRSDALSTLLVLVAMLCAKLGFVYVDGVAGIGVALIIIYSGYIIARDAISPLLGERPRHETLRRIEQTARELDGVHGVHDVIVHRYGQMNLISLHIEVDDSRPITELHDLSEQVEERIEKKLSSSAVVHIDPLNKDHPRYEEIYQAIRQITDQDERIESFHDLRIVGSGERTKAIFDITINDSVSRKETQVVIQTLRDETARRIPGVRLVIKAEPPYAYSIEQGK